MLPEARITTEYYENGLIKEECYFFGNLIHMIASPACIKYWPSGQKYMEFWFLNNQRHRLDGPAVIHYYPSGRKRLEAWFRYDEPYKPEDKITSYIFYEENGDIDLMAMLNEVS